MIGRKELAEYGKAAGFDLGQAEKDYLQHLFLIFLTEQTQQQLVFKGGTALQKAYGLNRYSIDLDFTAAEKAEFGAVMEKIAAAITRFGYPAEVKERKTLGRTFLLKIKGPLYNEGKPASICTLRIEISFRENVLLAPELREIVPVYPDLRPYSVHVMSAREILAEKVRAVMGRNEPRDAFDLYFLLRKQTPVDIRFINSKLAYYGESYDEKKFADQLNKFRQSWESELKTYTKNIPPFASVLETIIRGLKAHAAK
ncbi:nucleotidyl transferase AbiEii/AbiGii toxin family protein [Candidatus Woesearchaeota archaeon]|nr:nucleotidyl transferase AbiEii/AbiGii toxin family protein [Candidatus Woesearchaeota archaeon]